MELEEMRRKEETKVNDTYENLTDENTIDEPDLESPAEPQIDDPSQSSRTLDPDKLIYSLRELKSVKSKGVFIVKRDHIDQGYRTSITDTPITTL
jgi:hypothetical protein